jgi:hypothetical protein
MSKKKNRVVFAESTEGELFIELPMVTSLMVALVDNLRIVYWPDNPRRPYLYVSDAIAWLQREIPNTKDPSFLKLKLDTLQMAQRKHAAGEGVYAS